MNSRKRNLEVNQNHDVKNRKENHENIKLLNF